MVTAELPPFARSGSRIDVAVSSLGDATNLTGDTLLVTPLLAADGEVYAVALGALATGAIAARGGAGTSVTRGVPTAGRISSGATVARGRLPTGQGRRIAAAINRAVGTIARATDPRTVSLDFGGAIRSTPWPRWRICGWSPITPPWW
jgi:flagellar P-ring protein FlgI